MTRQAGTGWDRRGTAGFGRHGMARPGKACEGKAGEEGFTGAR